MLTDPHAEGVRKPEARTKVTNRTALFASEVDERGLFARRLYDLLAAHVADLGGWDQISEAQASIARRAAILTITLEQLETKMANLAEPSQNLADLYSRLAGQLRRLLESLGLERRQRDVTPTIGQILEGARRARAAKESDEGRVP